MTTNELMTAWLDRCERERVKPRTYSRYKGLIVQHILPELGDTQIDDLGRRQISEFLTAHQADGNLRGGEALSATSTNLMLTVLNAAFTYACDMELLPANPCDRIRRVPGSPSRVEAFTREEQRRLEEAIAVSEDRCCSASGSAFIPDCESGNCLDWSGRMLTWKKEFCTSKRRSTAKRTPRASGSYLWIDRKQPHPNAWFLCRAILQRIYASIG